MAVESASQHMRVPKTSSTSSSHPNSIGEKNAVASQNGNGLEQVTKLESSPESIIKPEANGVSPHQPDGGQLHSYGYKAATATAGYFTSKIRGVSSVFGSRRPFAENSFDETPVHTPRRGAMMQNTEAAESDIQLIRPSCRLRPLEIQTEDETVEVRVTKMLVTSYYDIVRKNVQDLVPKAIMHFLVNYTKSNLLGTLMQTLYRENLFDDLLKEEDEIAMKRKNTNKMFRILQQAVQTLDDVVADVCLRKSSSDYDVTGAWLRLPDPKSSFQSSMSDVGISFEELDGNSLAASG